MKTVWKSALNPSAAKGAERTVYEIEMPIGAQALTVSADTGEPCLWALVDPQRTKQTRRFLVLGTGHGGPEGLDVKRYVGTFFVSGGVEGAMMGLPAVLVFHVFEA